VANILLKILWEYYLWMSIQAKIISSFSFTRGIDIQLIKAQLLIQLNLKK